MIGSSRPSEDKLSLTVSQKAKELSDLGVLTEKGGILDIVGVAVGGAEAGAGGGVLRIDSEIWEGNVPTVGTVGCDSVLGDIVATMADSLSSFLSKSRILFGVWPSLRAFADLLRATCSTHSTLAFWHLHTCHSSGALYASGETYL